MYISSGSADAGVARSNASMISPAIHVLFCFDSGPPHEDSTATDRTGQTANRAITALAKDTCAAGETEAIF